MPSPHPSIVEALERNALRDPNKPAFIFVNETLDRQVLTRQQIWDYCRKFAAMLRQTGLGKGDVVCNSLPNSPQRLLSILGTVTAGCITMGAQSCMADGSDFVSSLNRGKASGIILDTSDKKGIFPILKHKLQRHNTTTGEVSCEDIPSLKYLFSCTLGSGSKFLHILEEFDMFQEDIDPNDICVYMSTSGSTGQVKLAPKNSYVLMEIAEVAFKFGNDGTNNKYMCDLDLGWISGFPYAYLLEGTTQVLLDRGSDIPDNSALLHWRVVVQEKCTHCFTSPLLLLEIPSVLVNCENADMKNYRLKTIIGGGGQVTRKHVEASVGIIADELRIFYGSTETGLTTCKKIYCLDDYEIFNTGHPTNNTQVKIADTNNKTQDVPAGEYGEVLIKTTQSLHHYINDPESTAQTFDPDGWVRLGDVGKLNAKGQLYIMGRNKFAISKGTIVFYPEVIESFVRKCPGIKDVVIVGVPDDKLFEEICALIIKNDNAEISEKDVLEFCEDIFCSTQSMAPKYILFVTSFPRTYRGKLDRKKAKNLACEKLWP